MNKFVLIVATFGIPLLAFLMLQDAVATFYRPDETGKLAYQVVEPEAVDEEVEDVEEPDAEGTDEEAVEDAANAVEEEQSEAEEVPQLAEPEVETNDEEPADTEAGEADQPDVSEVEPVETATVALSDEEMAAGKRLMRKCAACHQYERDRNGVGPHLVDVVGRAIGSVEGYRYSDVLLGLGDAGGVWTQEALIAWLENPADFAPGTKMNFKVSKADERELIAAWLAANGS